MGWNHLNTVWGSLFFEKAIKFLHWYFLLNGKKLLSFTVPKKKTLSHTCGDMNLGLQAVQNLNFQGYAYDKKISGLYCTVNFLS